MAVLSRVLLIQHPLDFLWIQARGQRQHQENRLSLLESLYSSWLARPPGTRLGVCKVTAHLGEGGMGQVYRATDTRLKRQVAIKILPPSLAADPTGIRTGFWP